MKAGSPTGSYWESADVATFLPPLAGMLAIEALGLPVTQQNTAQFCSIDPPTDLPGIGDYLSLAIPPLAILNGTFQRFGNYVKASKWRVLCECIPAGAGYTCTFFQDHVVAANDPYFFGWGGVNLAIPAGAVAFRARVDVVGGGVPDWQVAGFDDAGANVANPTILSGSATALVNGQMTDWGWTSAITHISVHYNGTGRTASFAWCTAGTSGTPPAPALVAPPPDFIGPNPVAYTLNDVKLELQAIDGKIELLRLLQAQPAYQVNAVSPGVTGQGEIPIPTTGGRPLGLLVTATTLPGWLSARQGDPVSYWEWGTVTMGTAFGWYPHQRLTQNPQMFAPLPPSVSRFGYSFLPGVVGTIAQLQAPL